MVQLANTPGLIRKAHRLRCENYCIETDYLDGTGLEVDEFDCRSCHVIIPDNITGEVIGTVRLVLWQKPAFEASFPIELVIPIPLRHYVPRRTTAEVSRFATSKKWRDPAGAEAALLPMRLVQGLVCLSAQLGITHWVSLMQPSLLHVLEAGGIYLNPIGKPVDFYGICQPCYAQIDTLLARVYFDRRETWDLLTDGGTLWPPPKALAVEGLAA